MCSCSESALENEPKISFVDEDGNEVANEYPEDRWGGPEITEWAVVGVKVVRESMYDIRDSFKFIVRPRCTCGRGNPDWVDCPAHTKYAS